MLNTIIKSIVFVAVALLFLSSCVTRKKNINVLNVSHKNATTLNIDKVSNDLLIEIDTIIDKNSISFIPLQTTSESLFGGVSKVFASDSSFFIYDSQLQTVLEFSKNGDFIKKIGNKGRGPFEYTGIRSVFYNNWNNTLEILDVSRRLIKYDVNTGAALEEPRLVFDNFSVDMVYPASKDGYLLYNNFNLHTKDKLENLARIAYMQGGEFKYSTLPYPYGNKRPFPFIVNSMFYSYEDSICFFEPFNSKVYNVLENGIETRYNITFESLGNTEHNLEKEVGSWMKPSKSGPHIRLIHFLETKRYIFLGFSKTGDINSGMYEWRRALYDKQQKKCLGNSRASFFIGELLLEVFLDHRLNDQLLCAQIPARIIRVHQKLIQDGVKEWTPLMKKLMALEVEEEDNPVLMLMKVK